MKRPLSPFEQELVNAMDEYARGTTPPAFDASRIVTRERRRIRVRISLATVSVATAAGIAACVAAGAPQAGNGGLPVTGGTTAPPSASAGVASPAPSASQGSVTRGGNPASPASGGSSNPGTHPSWPSSPTGSPFAGSAPPVPELVSIGVGGHPEGGYDQISLRFTGQAPGFSVRYVSHVVRDGSGAPVALPGSAYLQLVFASAQAHDDNGSPTLHPTPTNPVTVGLPELRSYVLNGDFEGTVSVALGLSSAHGFRVSETTSGSGDTAVHTIYIQIAR